MEILALLIVAPLASFSLCFCFATRERRQKAVALAEQKRLLETNANYVRLRLAELGVADDATGPRMLVEHNGAGEHGDENKS